MTLPTVDLVARVIPPTASTNGVGALDRLGVDHPGGGHRVPTRLIPHRIPQPIMNAVDGAVGFPGGEVVIHRRPRRQVTRQLPPRTARAGQVEDRVDDLSPGMGQGPPESSPTPLRRQQRLHQRPLRIGQIRVIAASASMINHSNHGDHTEPDHQTDTPIQINFPNTFLGLGGRGVDPGALGGALAGVDRAAAVKLSAAQPLPTPRRPDVQPADSSGVATKVLVSRL